MNELVKRRDFRNLAHEVVDSWAVNLERPEFRVGLTASAVTAAVLARMGARFVPAMVLSLAVGWSAERVCGAVLEISAKLNPPQLLFHGAGCLGHTTGLPAESCMAATDAPGEV